VLSVTAVNSTGLIVGHASFYDYPLAGSVLHGKPKPKEWTDWFDENFGAGVAGDVTPFNSLFLGFFVVDPTVSERVTAEILRTLFVAVPDLKHCLCAPINPLTDDESVYPFFTPLKASNDAVGTMYTCTNEKLYPNVYVREAAPQDFDDLKPIFDSRSTVLKERYGNDEFYLAELIEAQDDFNKCLVMEVGGVAVGFMSISTEADVEVLRECFELNPWDSLKRSAIEMRTVVEEAAEPTAEELAEEAAAAAVEEEARAASAKKKKGGGGKGKGPEGKSSKVNKSKKGGGDDEAAAAAAEAEKKKKRGPKTTQVEFEVLTESTFAIAMMCIDEEYEGRSLDFMPAAFAAFPDKDFCVLTTPHNCGEPPLLSQFSRAIPKQKAGPPQELYIMHRNALFTDVTVVPAVAEHFEEIQTLLAKTDDKELVVADLERYFATGTDAQGVALNAFVTLSCGKVVGVAVGRTAKEDSSKLRAHYNVEDYILYPQHATYEHGHLHHFILNPVFDRHRKFVLREVMRLWGKSNVYFKIYADHADLAGLNPSTFSPILDDMVPVRRRRQVVYPLATLMSNAPSTRIRDNGVPYALSFLTRKLMHEPKTTINNRIVVVGASDTALSFLETMCIKSHLRFNNLTLVSPHGLPSGNDDRPADSFLSTTHAYSAADRQQIGLETWVNVVEDKMVRIDREYKVLILESGAILPYDCLVLTPGLQYMAEAPETPNTPNNVYALNDAEDAAAFLQTVATTPAISEGTTLVYGDTIDAYAAVQGLLSHGIPGDMIELVRPPHPAGEAEGACFGDAQVQEKVEHALMAAGVKVHDGLELISYSCKEGSLVEVGYALFTEPIGPNLQIHCDALLNFATKRVDPTNFQAVNDSCLVFDGRLVIDNNFATADPAIFAAGPFTKYSRRFFATGQQPEVFDSVEIGRSLAEAILPQFDVLSPRVQLGTNEVRKFVQPKTVGAILPGGMVYLHQRAPTTGGVKAEAGRSLVTAPPLEDGKIKYVSVEVDRYSSVSSICVLTNVDTVDDRSNLLNAFAINEKYFNNMVSRFDEGLIHDFLAFFRDPTVLACFHDRFSDFVDEISNGVRGNSQVKTAEFEMMTMKLAKVQMAGGDDAEMVKAAQALVESDVTKKFAKDKLLDFLTFNAYHLPMYARPGTY
jgi:hypothetical protein